MSEALGVTSVVLPVVALEAEHGEAFLDEPFIAETNRSPITLKRILTGVGMLAAIGTVMYEQAKGNFPLT